ncbi:hypothetical protein L5F24_07585 [Aliarcobacter butzleri]|uniref:hypothetical protein n=1 Tax=Aliarcobacter butzleri TaxID=28197 RepID=UPI001EDB699B|nr:hypothetical protein [Aliarcobacter butzleri]MCG3667863.1 hypothetical protein [Aliarcobacter butzleri]
MNKAIIPYQVPNVNLPTKSANFHSKNFSEKRNALLSELRCISGIPEIVSNFSQDAIYKLVAVPEGGKLFKDSAGNIKGVFYKDGKIIEHAKFQTVQPAFIKAATAVGSQILLVSIAMQLNRIEKEISKIREELHNDRVSEILSGVKQFRNAMKAQDHERQSRLIENAIQTLHTGLEKTIKSLTMQIREAPDTEIGFFDNWLTNKATEAKEKFELAEESFQASLLGIQVLSECYATINEPDVAASSLKENLMQLKNSGIETAAKKARLIPAKANVFPEEPWLSFLEMESLLVNEIDNCPFLANNELESIEIEFKPTELMEK